MLLFKKKKKEEPTSTDWKKPSSHLPASSVSQSNYS